MSWYESEDGELVWVGRDETVYTVIPPSDNLETEELIYLSVSTSKAVFKEQLIDDDTWDTGYNKRKMKKKFAGKQRGFLFRIEHDENLRVVEWFRDVCATLQEMGVCSKVDANEAENRKKLKPGGRGGRYVGVNECRVETIGRCHHVACGPGIKVEVSRDLAKQRINLFTNHRVLPADEWHRMLVDVVQQQHGRVFQGRRLRDEVDGDSNEEVLVR